MRSFRLFKGCYGKDLPFQHPQSFKSHTTFKDDSFCSVRKDEKGCHGKDLPFQLSRKNRSQSKKSELAFEDDLPQSPRSVATFQGESICSVRKDEIAHQLPAISSECHSPCAKSPSPSPPSRINTKWQKPKFILKYEKWQLRKKQKLELALKLVDSVHTNRKKRVEVFRLSGYEDPEPYMNDYNSGLVFVKQQNVYNMGPIKESASIICEKIDLENGEDEETPEELCNKKHPLGNHRIKLFDDKRLEITSQIVFEQ